MDKLYYISQGDHLENIKNACEGGLRLVQLRAKEVSFTVHVQLALKVKKICDSYGAILIINDNVALAELINAQGVHLGKSDECPREARAVLGMNKIIGATANTYEDCVALINKKVDYIGLGPFRFTSTKQHLSPLLGLEGYRNILKKLRDNGYKTPVYAIGGIQKEDVEALFKTNINGVAVSGILSGKTTVEIKSYYEYISNCGYRI
ncbi:MAG: thiamine phosphate synthase [Flavobacteriaceae bacterium]|nr:MAG: thiamine phosphate synthase [Flavobacteriaceae bacterium]